MNEFIYQTLTVTGGLSGVAALIVTWCVLKVIGQEKAQREADRRERNALVQKLERLENEKFASLQKKLEDHLAEDKPGEVALQFRHLNGTLLKLGDKLDKVAEDVTTLKAESKEKQRLYEKFIQQYAKIA